MLFTSFAFIGLLALTFLLYYFPFLIKFQITLLIVSSLVFYSYNQPMLVLLLLFSVSINITSSYYVVYGKQAYRKTFAVIGVALNLGILIFFKYSSLLAVTFFNVYSSVGDFFITLPLPIGISFFTFQGISLVVDVYKEKHFNNKEIVPVSFFQHSKRVMFFKSFFPQLISGPIVKAHDFIPQIQPKYLKDIQIEACIKNIIMGYFLKMVVADNLKDFTNLITYPIFQTSSTLNLLTLLFGFSSQIFADFAGYSLIAIGLAKLFGYDFPDNFNFPYISTSFSEFWKRWHISLSSFLMEYFYIPLGGNRMGKTRTYINLMLVMLLGGIWHGAAWSYAVWGAFHGAALIAEKIVNRKHQPTYSVPIKIIKGLVVFTFVTLAWLLFKLPNFNQVVIYFECILSNSNLTTNYKSIVYILLYSLPIVLYHFMYLAKNSDTYLKIKAYDYLVYGILLFLIITNSGSSQAFIYFQF